MSHSVLLVGWDVGPWKCSGESEDALCLLGWDGTRLSEIGGGFHGNLFQKLTGEITLDSFLAVAGRSTPGPAKVVIAIDAVFGWPRRFVELIAGTSTYAPNTGRRAANTNNRFLYRETERFLNDTLEMGSRFPKTAVGDALGSAATKAQYVLAHLRRGKVYAPPLDPWDLSRAARAQVTVVEAYPGAAKFSPTFENLKLPNGNRLKQLDKGDRADAQRCAMVAACYARLIGAVGLDLPDLYVPTDATQEAGYDPVAILSEGWIFSPRKG